MRMRGYSLVELLVAIIVIGLGALGTAALQLANSKNTRIALERTTAVILAQDMAERLRANPSGDYLGVAEGTGPLGFVNCLARNCASHELERFDIAVWKCSLGRWAEEGACHAARAAGALPSRVRQPGLPMGDGEVNWGTGGEFTVVVSWRAGGVQHASVPGRR